MRIEKLLYNPKVIIAKDGDKTFLMDSFNISIHENLTGHFKVCCIWRDGDKREMNNDIITYNIGYNYVMKEGK